MGRLKNWQNLNPLFSSKYKKLLEEFGSKDYSKLLIQDTIQDYISYNCKNCGHAQKLKADELNAIVSHAFRLAYVAHIQKNGVRDVKSGGHQHQTCVSSPHTSPPHSHFTYNEIETQLNPKITPAEIPSSRPYTALPFSSRQDRPEGRELRIHCWSTAGGYRKCPASGTDSPSTDRKSRTPNLTSNQTTCRVSSCSCSRENIEIDINSQNIINNRLVSVLQSDLESSSTLSSQSLEHPSPQAPVMRTLSSIDLRTTDQNFRSESPRRPPNLPGLKTPDFANNNVLSPDCENSNSPTQLNRNQRLGDKPPLVKNMNISCESLDRAVDEMTSFNSTDDLITSASTIQTKSRKSLKSTLLAYVNEKISNCSAFQNRIEGVHTSIKRSSEPESQKLMPQNSLNSSPSPSRCVVGMSTTNIAVDASPSDQTPDDSELSEDGNLKAAAWFQAGIPREIALEILSKEPVGAFMVRESTSKPGCFALSLRVPRDFAVSGIAHYLIVKTNERYKIKGFTKEFVSIMSLITHHSVMPELLPCPLSLSRYQPTFSCGNNNNNTPDRNQNEDSDYSTLSNFHKMMEELNE